MASTGVDYAHGGVARPPSAEKKLDEEKVFEAEARRPSTETSVEVNYDSTHRTLKPRHIQLIGIGGTIGTALYVQIGHGLLNGGPASLFLAFSIW